MAERFGYFWSRKFELGILRVLRTVIRVLCRLQQGYEVLLPRISPSDMVRDVLALHME